jgi:hypothetical protein
MEEKTIIFNGGRDQDIEPLKEADPFLARLLGAAPSRPAIPYLRVVQAAEGRQCIGVFIGSEHVGYLQPVEEGLLATVKACELNGAAARARGNLIASWEHPGKVRVRVNLADPEHLLYDPEPEEQDHPDVAVPQPDEGPAGASSAAPEISASLEGAVAPALTAGLPEDYPDWPLPKPDSLAPSDQLTPAEPSASDEPLQSVEPGRTDPPAPSGVSPQALLSTRGAWLGGEPFQPQASQTGWLGSTVSPSQTPSLGTVTTTPLGETSSGLGGTTSMGATTPGATAPAETLSWQDMAERAGSAPRNPDEEIIAAWSSSPAAARPAPTVAPGRAPGVSNTSKTWILSALAVVVLAAAAFLVWKFVFAPKTFTDDQYGYSFTYPGRWELVEDSSMFTEFPVAANASQMPSMALAGHGLDWSHPNEAAMVGVARIQLDMAIDASTLTTAVTQGVAQAAAQDPSVSVLEPVTTATLSGLQGCETTLSLTTTQGYSLTVTYYYLLDQGSAYIVIAASTNGLWSESQKTFKTFFNSFKPSATQI